MGTNQGRALGDSFQDSGSRQVCPTAATERLGKHTGGNVSQSLYV